MVSDNENNAYAMFIRKDHYYLSLDTCKRISLNFLKQLDFLEIDTIGNFSNLKEQSLIIL